MARKVFRKMCCNKLLFFLDLLQISFTLSSYNCKIYLLLLHRDNLTIVYIMTGHSHESLVCRTSTFDTLSFLILTLDSTWVEFEIKCFHTGVSHICLSKISEYFF